MSDTSDIEHVVMRRVRTIHLLRPLISIGAFAALILFVALWGIGREVWVAKVFANGPTDFLGHTRYLFYAFVHTRFLVQALVLATAGAAVVLARALLSPIASVFTPTPA